MIHIRNAREDETERLVEIGLRAWVGAMTDVGEADAMLSNARAAFRNFARSSWLTITVVERNGAPAGWAAREMLDENISDFWIDPAYARHGLGSALLNSIEADMIGQGLYSAAVQTHARNHGAVSFFEARGYRMHWLSVVYSPKLDRDIQSVGLSKTLVEEVPDTYGPGI